MIQREVTCQSADGGVPPRRKSEACSELWTVRQQSARSSDRLQSPGCRPRACAPRPEAQRRARQDNEMAVLASALVLLCGFQMRARELAPGCWPTSNTLDLRSPSRPFFLFLPWQHRHLPDRSVSPTVSSRSRVGYVVVPRVSATTPASDRALGRTALVRACGGRLAVASGAGDAGLREKRSSFARVRWPLGQA